MPCRDLPKCVKSAWRRRLAILPDAFILGELEGRQVAFLARHGRGHKLLPTELNFRANIYAMKALGVERILSVSAVGSLKEEHKPTDFVMPDQFIDRTFARASTFFGDGDCGACGLWRSGVCDGGVGV